MRFITDFKAEDYIGLCWFQAKTPSVIISVALSMALGVTLAGVIRNIIIGVFIAAIAYPLILHFQKRSVIKRADKRFSAFGASSSLDLKIDDDEILQISNSGETRLPWADVYAVRESEDSYYVFLTKRKAFYFPKRSFTTKEQEKEFLTYIRKYVPADKIKLKVEK